MFAQLAAPLLVASALAWIDPAQVTVGQRGICVTEWDGGERIEIPVEVVGTLDPTSPGRRAVLVRLDDPRFAGAGVVAGMSGSPVYIDGRLLGAIAFGWAFAREPLAGVTPFAEMREIAAGPPSGAARAPDPAQLAAVASGAASPLSVLPTVPLAAGRAALPLAIGGLGAPTAFGDEVLARLGMQQVATGGGSVPEGAPEAGDMVAALLVWGDATLAAGGTVTAREGDTLWAFGHPFLALGGVRIPAARARALAIQTSFQNSFKIFTAGAPIGTFVADRPPGMLARVGPAPAGIPVTVEVVDPLGTQRRAFRVAEEPLLEPLLVTFLSNASMTARGSAGEASVRMTVGMSFADGRTVAVRHAGRGIDAVARAAAFAGGVVAFAEGSPYPHPALSGVSVRVERDERPTGAVIAEAVPARTSVRAGETLDIRVRMEPHLEEPRWESLQIRIPPEAIPGASLDLVVANGAAWSEYRLKAVGADPADFATQMELLETLEPSTELVAALETRDRGVSIPGASRPDLPPSWAATLAIGLGRNAVRRLPTAIVAVERRPAPYPLEGAVRIPLTVRAAEEP
ncbi:MAG: SpoIVB peptidase S55 domain-containing protein [Acidobacteriota bacterium]